MSRYIDAEHFRRWVIARWEERDTTNPYPLSGSEILDQIEREEYFAADIQEVRHGHWVYEKGDCFPKCSVCRQYHGTLYEHYYCPVCGAKMNGDIEYA